MACKNRSKPVTIVASLLLLSAVAGCSIADAFESSLQLQPVGTRLLHRRSELCSLFGVGNNAIIDRQDFLADALRSTTTSSIAIASTTGSSTTDTMPAMTKTTAKDAEFVCQNGALTGESAIPGAYSSACMGLSERIVPLPRYRERVSATIEKQSGNESVDIQQKKEVLQQAGTIVVQQKAGGSGNTGMTVWNSGLLLTRLLDAMVEELQQRQGQRGGEYSNANFFWANQDVIELGCGTGLCSIAAYRLGAKSVVATDGNPRVLQLADTNIRQNFRNDIESEGPTTPGPLSTPEVPSDSPSTIRAESLQWGFLNAMDYSESASFVIGADLTYNPGSWDILAETIATVLKTENENIANTGIGATRNSKQCYALYLSVGHDGFNVNAEVDGFLSLAKEKGLVNIPDGVEGIDLNELLQKTLTDAENEIIARSGGFRVVVLGRKTVKPRY